MMTYTMCVPFALWLNGLGLTTVQLLMTTGVYAARAGPIVAPTAARPTSAATNTRPEDFIPFSLQVRRVSWLFPGQRLNPSEMPRPLARLHRGGIEPAETPRTRRGKPEIPVLANDDPFDELRVFFPTVGRNDDELS